MAAISTLEKLVNLQQRRIQIVDDANKTQPTSDQTVTEPVLTQGEPEVIAVTEETVQPKANEVLDGNASLRETCLKEQLESVYSDLEYLSKHFPGQTIRSLVDLACKAGLATPISETQSTQESVTPPDNGIVPGSVLAMLEKVTEQSLADHPLGLVEIEESGKFLWMNHAARNALGVNGPDQLRGNFFTDVAPGANNSIFYGRFLQGRMQQTFDVEFNYAFAYRTTPSLCTVHMLKTPKYGRYFIFLKKLEG